MIPHPARNVGNSRAGSRPRRLVGRPVRLVRRVQPALAGLALLMLSCSEEIATTSSNQGQAGSSTQGGEAGADGAAGSSAQGSAGGSSPQGANPRTIYELLARINELPRPVELPHFLESLQRPLALNSTSNTQSAQPALGKRSPRIFIILNESLSLSLVPGAEPTLEFGERNAGTPGFSVKGELHFPVEEQLVPEDAFARLAPDAASGRTLEQATRCGVCHDNEKATPDYPQLGAFTSAIVKPSSFFAVDVAAIRRERDGCDSALEPERCAVLQALFDHGDVVQAAFP
jgi:hypothetical protein